MLLALTVASTAPAWATGTVRIQQNDDSVKTYTNVAMRVVNKTLALTSADKVSTVVIKGAACAPAGDLVRCTGGGIKVKQDEQSQPIPFASATFYYNPTESDETLPLSTTKIGSHCVIFAARTVKGTYITGSGKLDELPSK